jgi:hypothetical protein
VRQKLKEEKITMLTAFTVFHVLISLAAIGAGFAFVYGLLTSQRLDGWTSVFLSATVATSITGFMFPFHKVTPGHILGLLSLVALAIAIFARRRFLGWGALRKTYVISSMVALYFNVFVLVVQLFEKVPALQALAPTQSEPPFQAAQIALLLILVVLTIFATSKFHVTPTTAQGRATHA